MHLINGTMTNDIVVYLRGGTYRVTATIEVAPPPPNPDPDPPPPDPTPKPQVTFGPISGPLQYEGIGALRQNGFTWRILVTFNSVGTVQGIASRDESGQTDRGHLTIWLGTGGKIKVRNQAEFDATGTAVSPTLRLDSQTVVVPGREYEIEISLRDKNQLLLFVDGVLEASAADGYGLAGTNNLPLTLGASCTSCKADGSVGPHDPIDGTVYMEIWDNAKPPPEPIASLELSWVNPTSYVNGNPIGPGELTEIRLYQDGQKIAGVDPDVAVYEATGLFAGREYCFEATAVAAEESDPSNQVCRTP